MARFKANSNLLDSLNKQTSVQQMQAAAAIPEYDTKNVQGFQAYSIDDACRLVSMLNTLKLDDQFYKSANQQIKELQELVEKIGSEDPLFLTQVIRFSRCHEKGAGMRSINHVAAALAVPFIRGTDYAEKFFGKWDDKRQRGGTIRRLDDMSEIQEVYKFLNGGSNRKGHGKSIANSMKRAFARILENTDETILGKYKKTVIDIARLVHPDISKAIAKTMVKEKDKDGKEIEVEYSTIDAILKGKTVKVKTHEQMQSEAGQIVATARKEGKITEEEAKEVLKEAKANNWRELLDENRLPIGAAVKELHNVLLTRDSDIVDKICKLISNTKLLKFGKILPYQLDFAYEVLKADTQVNSGSDYRKICSALEKGIEGCVSNLREYLPGRTCILYDKSGSMGGGWSSGYIMIGNNRTSTTCAKKAALLAAMLAKGTDADIIKFGDRPTKVSYNPKESVFELAGEFEDATDSCTNLSRAFDLLIREKRVYDRIFIISDNECNRGDNREAYKSYVRTVCNPYIYLIDLASYGTQPIKNGDKVRMLFGYSTTIFDQVKDVEYNPMAVMDLIRSIQF